MDISFADAILDIVAGCIPFKMAAVGLGLLQRRREMEKYAVAQKKTTCEQPVSKL